jgi:hypothetical protein
LLNVLANDESLCDGGIASDLGADSIAAALIAQVTGTEVQVVSAVDSAVVNVAEVFGSSLYATLANCSTPGSTFSQQLKCKTIRRMTLVQSSEAMHYFGCIPQHPVNRSVSQIYPHAEAAARDELLSGAAGVSFLLDHQQTLSLMFPLVPVDRLSNALEAATLFVLQQDQDTQPAPISHGSVEADRVLADARAYAAASAVADRADEEARAAATVAAAAAVIARAQASAASVEAERLASEQRAAAAAALEEERLEAERRANAATAARAAALRARLAAAAVADAQALELATETARIERAARNALTAAAAEARVRAAGTAFINTVQVVEVAAATPVATVSVAHAAPSSADVVAVAASSSPTVPARAIAPAPSLATVAPAAAHPVSATTPPVAHVTPTVTLSPSPTVFVALSDEVQVAVCPVIAVDSRLAPLPAATALVLPHATCVPSPALGARPVSVRATSEPASRGGSGGRSAAPSISTQAPFGMFGPGLAIPDPAVSDAEFYSGEREPNLVISSGRIAARSIADEAATLKRRQLRSARASAAAAVATTDITASAASAAPTVPHELADSSPAHGSTGLAPEVAEPAKPVPKSGKGRRATGSN